MPVGVIVNRCHQEPVSLTLAALLAVLLALSGACAPAREADGTDAGAPSAGGTAPAPIGTASPTPPPVIPRGTPTVPASPTAGVCADPMGCYGPPRRVGTFDAEVVPGASGLAASERHPGVLYLLDDRPGTSEVWVLDADGSMRGAIAIAGMEALDTESLAVGPCAAGDREPCLYVGDIGDNRRSRADIVVHRLPEPDLSAGLPQEPQPVDTVRLRYPAQRHDAEVLLVDDAGVLHIVTKAPFDAEHRTTGEARLLRADVFADVELTDLGPVPVPEPEAPLQSRFVGNVVTGGDHRDGRVLLRTYDQVLEYIAPGPDADLATLAEWTVRAVPSPPELQSEAITWAHDGCGYLTAGEMVGDVWLVPCLR